MKDDCKENEWKWNKSGKFLIDVIYTARYKLWNKKDDRAEKQWSSSWEKKENGNATNLKSTNENEQQKVSFQMNFIVMFSLYSAVCIKYMCKKSRKKRKQNWN